MKLEEKLAPAKRALEFIARHDDAPIEERALLVTLLKDYADAELQRARERAAARLAALAGKVAPTSLSA